MGKIKDFLGGTKFPDSRSLLFSWFPGAFVFLIPDGLCFLIPDGFCFLISDGLYFPDSRSLSFSWFPMVFVFLIPDRFGFYFCFGFLIYGLNFLAYSILRPQKRPDQDCGFQNAILISNIRFKKYASVRFWWQKWWTFWKRSTQIHQNLIRVNQNRL